MSVFNKVPYIEGKIGALSDAQKTLLTNAINTSTSGYAYYSLVDENYSLKDYCSQARIVGINLELEKGKPARSGFLLYNGTWCVFLTYNQYGNVHIYELDLDKNAFKRIEEECSIEEVRRILGTGAGGGGGELTPEALSGVLEGSDYVVVDENEQGEKLQVRLDQDVVEVIKTQQIGEDKITVEESSGNIIISFNAEDALKEIIWDNMYGIELIFDIDGGDMNRVSGQTPLFFYNGTVDGFSCGTCAYSVGDSSSGEIVFECTPKNYVCQFDSFSNIAITISNVALTPEYITYKAIYVKYSLNEYAE